MRHKKITVLLLAVLMAASAAIAAADQEVTKIAVYSDFAGFDPYNSGMDLDKVVYDNIFDCLLRFYNGEFEKVLCTDYDISEDGKEYTFKLRDDATFHNGEKFTAADVIFSMKRAKESSEMSNYTKNITDVVALDDYTVKIVLDAPYVPFLTSVAAQVCIMNEKAVLEAGDNIKKAPCGTGPYIYKEWVSGSKVVLERNENYYGEKPQIKNVEFVVLTNQDTALNALETGEIDLTYTVPSIAVPMLQKNKDIAMGLNPTLGSGYIVMNLEADWVKDPNFRMALMLATNRDNIINMGMDGVANPSTHVWDERTAGFSGKYDSPEYNIELAKEYLAKTNYNGEVIPFIVGMESYKKVAIVYQEDLKEIGVNIDVQMLETNTWVSNMKTGKFSMSTIVQTFGPDVDLWNTVFASSAIGGYNFSRLNSETVDKAFAEGAICQDPEKRAEIYSEIEKEIYEGAVVIPIYNRVVTCAHKKDLAVERAYTTGFSTLSDMHWN
jgi:peptide/nickel transport system substrate-binding protein